MELGELVRKKHNKFRPVLIILAAAIFIAAAFGMFWLNGAFLPSWIEWKNGSAEIADIGELVIEHRTAELADPDGKIIWSTDKGIKVQDMLLCDIDRDQTDELMILCWKIGRYGDRKPFWVDRDELKWSQHIYIYEINDSNLTASSGDDGRNAEYITSKWMASDIHTDVKRWEIYDESLIKTYSPDGDERVWIWDSWGLSALTDEQIETLNEKNSAAGNDAVAPASAGTDDLESTDTSPKKETGSDEPAAPDDISIIMVGDVLLHDGITAACKKDDGTYDFAQLFENTKDVIEDADIAIVNQEVILGGEELRITGYPTFNGPFEVADALEDAGFDVICHATNHALDRGKKGIISCLSNYRDNHPALDVIGIYDNEEDGSNILIKEIDGVKIAILNYTYGTNGIPLPDGMPYAVNIINKEKIASDLAYAEENADFTIVCPHWGIEYQLSESSEQDELAIFMTENGADLIIGTHPHVIEPVKWVESENGNRSLCYYSLGNFINWTSGRGSNVANRMVGGMAYVELNAEDETGAGRKEDSDMIDDYAVLPLISHVEHVKSNVTTYFLEDYTEELAAENAIIEQDPAFDLEYCITLCGEVWEGVPQNIVDNH